jgi:predicted O-linked N-acetylglucosamine transferase (SPINDLY family)
MMTRGPEKPGNGAHAAGSAEVAYANGNALRRAGRLPEAIAAYRQALAIKPDYPAAMVNLASALHLARQLEEAVELNLRALALRPGHAGTHNNLGLVLHDRGELDQALGHLSRAVALAPGVGDFHNNLGLALKTVNQLDAAMAAFAGAIRLSPDNPRAYSNFILAAHYNPAYQPADVLAAARQFDDRFVKPLASARDPYGNDRSPDRPLRIGFVSADFSSHAVGRCLLPLLLAIDRSQVRVYLYSNMQLADALTEAVRARADAWRDITTLDDDVAALLVRADGIDILIDLSLHTADNRLLLFARKPAPVQVSYLGYVGTSGVSTIDYRLSDPQLDPPGADVSVYSEQTVRLARSYWCFHPVGLFPEVGPLPAQSGGGVTFGCLNNFCKVSSAALQLWAQVLGAVPGSNLLLHAPAGVDVAAVRKRFEVADVDGERVQFVGQQGWQAYLETYNRIDIALDPFPYNGGVTTADGLWMGVPAVTLLGQNAVGRAGSSILTNANLPELIADSPQAYVRLAAALAADLTQLAALRSGLRSRMTVSPLMNAPRFARDFEAALRQMWRDWCRGGDGGGGGNDGGAGGR